mmetsp:Transcript_30517/g.85473  ORF Transcript_30517/g.85473 Transcript_30517/m.85473 type:complete len:203 (-) Transcript_30517:53-661(-)
MLGTRSYTHGSPVDCRAWLQPLPGSCSARALSSPIQFQPSHRQLMFRSCGVRESKGNTRSSFSPRATPGPRASSSQKWKAPSPMASSSLSTPTMFSGPPSRPAHGSLPALVSASQLTAPYARCRGVATITCVTLSARHLSRAAPAPSTTSAASSSAVPCARAPPVCMGKSAQPAGPGPGVSRSCRSPRASGGASDERSSSRA